MGFGAAIRTCFRRYVGVSGRAPRSEFWWFVVFLLLAQIVLTVVNSVLFGPTETVERVLHVAPDGSRTIHEINKLTFDAGVMGTLFTLATFLPFVAVGVRRLHDRNLRGWWLLLPPALGLAVAVGAIVEALGWSQFVEAIAQTGHVSVNATGSAVFSVGLLVVLGSCIWLVVTLARRGTDGPNRFGPDPVPATESLEAVA